jgi:hypothetical protein
MTSLRKTVLYSAGIMFSCLGMGGAQTGNNALSPAETKAGWQLLFDGKDKNAHWRHGETGSQLSKWTIEDSALRTVDEYSFLCTKTTDQFSDMEWKADWKLDKAGNSGLFIRVVTSTYSDGHEYGILDDVNGGDRLDVSKNPADKLSNGKFPYIKRTGGIYDLYPTTRNGAIGGQYYDSTVSRPYTQWSQGVIFANGKFIEHWLNGKKVVDVELGSADWIARFRNSKWNDGKHSETQWSMQPKGSLCIQAHGGGQNGWFRNLKVRPFTPGEKLNSPLITPKGGDFTGSTKVHLDAAITGATIRYTLDGTTPGETSPIFTDTLTVAKTTTLKTATFRAKFQTSDVETAVFTIGGTGIEGKSLVNPDVELIRQGRSVTVLNRNGASFSGEILGVDGKVAASFGGDRTTQEVDLAAMESGVYVIRFRAPEWIRNERIFLP